MAFSKYIKPIIYIYSLFLIFLAFLTGKSIDENILKWASGGAGFLTLVYFIYEKWVWKWPVFRILSEFQGVPVLHGTWKGLIEYDKDANGNPGSKEIYLVINQTLFSIDIRFFIDTSESFSVCASFQKEQSKRLQLIYTFRSSAPYGKRDTNPRHDGTAVLDVISKPKHELIGSYFTDRNTSGRINLKECKNCICESYSQAVSLFS